MTLLRRINNRNGVSLIEVLAALVVFAVGILSIIRMFPGGFATVRHSENSTIATRLAQAELERWQSRSDNLPEGILPWGPISATENGILPNIDPENLIDESDSRYSDVNKFRRVYCESTTIPSSSSTGEWGDASVYILGFSPIEYTDTSSVAVYSGPIRRRGLPRDTNNIFLKATDSRYIIDYADGTTGNTTPTLYLPPRICSYIVSFSYWVSLNGQAELRTALEQSVVVEAANIGAQYASMPLPGITLASGESFISVQRDSESVHRKFEPVAIVSGTPQWTDGDPYQYAIANTALGVLLFNPAGYGYEEVTSRGTVPLTANISYVMLDRHIVNEDRKVDDRGKIKLSLKFIKEIDQEYGGLKVYKGIAPDALLPFAVVAADLETGKTYYENDVDHPDGLFTVDYKNGVLIFPTAPPENSFVGHSFRVYYQADGDWAVQLYKALDTYDRSSSGVPDYKTYAWTNNGTLAFTKCWGGSTVAMDVKYTYTPKGGSESPIQLIRGFTRSIPLAGATSSFCEIKLIKTEFDSSDVEAGLEKMYPSDTVVNIKDITSVYGVSVGARVVWRENGHGSDYGRWKEKSLQTYMTRKGN